MASALRLPVVAEGAEHLVMGYLMRRNVLTYKAPPGNEAYELICIHPDPRHVRGRGKIRDALLAKVALVRFESETANAANNMRLRA